jgi:hypothetical protein
MVAIEEQVKSPPTVSCSLDRFQEGEEIFYTDGYIACFFHE